MKACRGGSSSRSKCRPNLLTTETVLCAYPCKVRPFDLNPVDSKSSQTSEALNPSMQKTDLVPSGAGMKALAFGCGGCVLYSLPQHKNRTKGSLSCAST